jgi:peptidoglycan/xylan/chitin deacetylase (PgdA/CDA1 family)
MKLINRMLIVTITIIMLTIASFIGEKKAIAIEKIENMPISFVNTDKKVVAIVCNVYEGENLLPGMLDVLDKYNTRISFFFGGVWVKRNPDTLMLINERGHDIQNHGYNHRLPTRLDSERNIKEIKDTEQLIQSITGIRTTLFEPPSGDYDSNTLALMEPLGYKMITWSVDTIDWREDATKEIILSRIAKKLKPGSIILMHPKDITASSLEDIIQYIQGQGYKITTVTDILSYK